MAQTRERSLTTACPQCGQQTLKAREVSVGVDQGTTVWRPQGFVCVNGCALHPGDVDEDTP